MGIVRCTEMEIPKTDETRFFRPISVCPDAGAI